MLETGRMREEKIEADFETLKALNIDKTRLIKDFKIQVKKLNEHIALI
jgi:hypothetical protein